MPTEPPEPTEPTEPTERKAPQVALRQKGFALIAVIWIGILLALIAAAFSSAVRSRLRETAGRAELIRAEAAADAGVRIALMELLNRGRDSKAVLRFPNDGTPVSCSIVTDITLIIRVEDEEGKVNLNTANEDLLVALFAGLGATHEKARGYAERVMDFRDGDHDKRLDGAEREDYAKSPDGLLGPKDADFAAIDELDQVLGLPPDLREKAKPFLTVFSGKDGIDASVASRGLRDILVAGSNGIVAASNDAGASGSAFSISSDLPRTFLSQSSRRAYGITAEAILPSGARYVSEAVAGLPNGDVGIPVFQHWRRGMSRTPAGQQLPVPKNAGPC
jgi:general secretion pathway protein K